MGPDVKLSVTCSLFTGTGEALFDHIAACLAEFTAARQINGLELPLGFTFSFP